MPGLRKEAVMAKILTDVEMAGIVAKAVGDPGLIDCEDSYRAFLEGLADLLCDHFGGEHGDATEPDDALPWTVAFRLNECVPEDGGVYRKYDTDVTWKGGEEL